jgi:hypothetical protein
MNGSSALRFFVAVAARRAARKVALGHKVLQQEASH